MKALAVALLFAVIIVSPALAQVASNDTALYRIEQLEKNQDKLEEEVDEIDDITVSIGRDLFWIRWGMMVVIPAVLGHFGFAIYQLATSKQPQN